MINNQSLRLISPLFVPADRPDRIGKALISGADAVIVDLEDAVAPDNKVHARNSFSKFDVPRQCPIYVRVNDINSDFFHDDIAAVAMSLAYHLSIRMSACHIKADVIAVTWKGLLIARSGP